MPRDHHTSKSKLSLGDKIGFNPSSGPCQLKKKCDKPKNLYQEYIGEYPAFIRTFGPKQYEAMSHYKVTFAAYGVASLLSICYICEWKAVLQYLPFYNGKYTDGSK
ncbi:uncharacterized protein LOC115874866 [Sitophilus oryzae]|uniref:Uncharacterized protein LOC115874866 n=1 Tax=Sitophilus oryzae TaxID=7048 RepID=A0A6J2X4E0_SITOR|nr:uncharacterized protein LOC115874866 [Sitophilus oryzae]